MSTYTNSEDPDEMQHNSAFHQDIYCLYFGKKELQTKNFFFFIISRHT